MSRTLWQADRFIERREPDHQDCRRLPFDHADRRVQTWREIRLESVSQFKPGLASNRNLSGHAR
jgi:hypothetical protein